MTREPFWNVQIPYGGEQLGLRPGPPSREYKVANGAYQVVMVGLARIGGIFLLTTFGATVVIVVGYTLAGWTGAIVLAAVLGTVLAVAIHAK